MGSGYLGPTDPGGQDTPWAFGGVLPMCRPAGLIDGIEALRPGQGQTVPPYA